MKYLILFLVPVSKLEKKFSDPILQRQKSVWSHISYGFQDFRGIVTEGSENLSTLSHEEYSMACSTTNMADLRVASLALQQIN
jgi:hypothetical protein